MPLSFEEVKQAYKRKPGSVKIIASTHRPRLNLYTGQHIFTKAMPAGVIGPDNPMFFPLSLDLSSKPSLTSSDLGPQHQGANVIGASAVNSNQKWTLSSLVPGRVYSFTVEADSLFGDYEEDANAGNTFRLNADITKGSLLCPPEHDFNFHSQTNTRWTILFKAKSDEVEITLTHKYNTGPLYYMTMKNYALEAVQLEK